MFIIIGGDGKEYGPVSANQVRTWLAAGRANAATQAKAVGASDWQTLGQFEEFFPSAHLPPLLPGATAPAAFAPGAGAPVVNRWLRFGGAFVDGLLGFFCKLPAALAIWRVLSPSILAGEQPSLSTMITATDGAFMKSAPFLIALALVQCALLSLRGQSVGKLLFRTRIVRHRDGGQAGFLHAFLLRGGVTWIIEQIPLLGSLFWLVDVCFVFGDERRCLHDYLAGTRVVPA